MFIPKLLQEFDQAGIQQTLAKGDYLIREGAVENRIYLIVEGAVKVGLMTDGDERIIRLGYDGSILNSISSFLCGEPSELYIQALKKTKVRILERDRFRSMIQRDAETTKEYVTFLETQLAVQIERELDLLVISPSERLARVLKRSPHIFRHIPLKYIASYLRMKPETLSRIRRY
jgi:CRP/FNR family transcriptional regulator, anaerobic regulatory protein